MKYFFETYGCQMNIAESAALALVCRERGWIEAENSDNADIVLLNTCSVRATAEQRVKGRLAHYAALKQKRAKPFILVLAGCMAERIGNELKNDYPCLDYTIGTSGRAHFPLILEAVEQGKKYIETTEKPEFAFSVFHFDGEGDGQSPFRSFVPIMHGCNNFCSYCIVPYVRGREVSRNPGSIMEEIRLAGERGVREITLLGQNVNSYLWDGRIVFPGLLEMIAKELEKTPVKRVRFLSSHPKDFSPELIRVMAEHRCFCRHLHLCVQHGSDKILNAMNRRYTRSRYLELTAALRSAMPDISLSTDILVGFPGETDEDFEQILTLMEEVKFLYAYMYHYNPREGTAACSLPGRISEEVKKRRLSQVIALQKRHTKELLKNRIGQKAQVLIEGVSRKNADEYITRTERDEMVAVCPGESGDGSMNLAGHFAKLTLSSLKGNTFRAVGFDLLD